MILLFGRSVEVNEKEKRSKRGCGEKETNEMEDGAWILHGFG